MNNDTKQPLDNSKDKDVQAHNELPLTDVTKRISTGLSDLECGLSEFGVEPVLPDGGFGWVVVAASFMVMFVIFGNLYSFGMIIDYYNTHAPFEGQKSTLLYTSTVNIAVMDIASLITGRLDDRFGHRICILVGGTVFGSAFILSSWATEAWHLILTQGVLLGLSGSVLLIATVSAPLQCFDKNRGLASGISAAGCGLGGLVLSPLVTYLLEAYGAPVVMRGLGITYFVIITIAGLVIKDFTKPAPSEVPWYDCSILKDSKFLLLLAGNTIASFGYLIPLLLVQDFAKAIELTSKHTSIIIGVTNGTSAVSRVICGLLADRFGVMNLLILCLMIMFLTCCALWPISTTFSSLIIFGMTFGFGLGGFASLPPVISSKLFGLRGLSTTNGWIYFFAGFPCLVGAPIALELVKITPKLYNHATAEYLIVTQYAGITALISALIFIALKWKAAPQIWARV